MNTPEYLDEVRRQLGLPSDYALQKPLGVSKTQISNYRNGKDSLSDALALRVAELLHIDAAKVLLDMHIERSKTPEIRAAWKGLLEKISEGFESLLLGASPLCMRVAER